MVNQSYLKHVYSEVNVPVSQASVGLLPGKYVQDGCAILNLGIIFVCMEEN